MITRRRKPSSRFSKMVRRRLDDTRALTASIDVMKDRIAEGLDRRLAPGLAEDETLPDFALSLDLVGRSAKGAADRLQTAERQRIDRGLEAAAVRRRSEKLARHEVYPRLVSVRRQIDSWLGKEDGRNVHRMVGKTLRKPRRLYGQLEVVVRALESDACQPPSAVESFETRRGGWLGEIQPGYERLTALLDQLEHMEMLEQAARDEKKLAMEAFDAAYGEALRLIQAIFAFAGHSGRLTRMLRSHFQRRLLIRRAREKRQARAEGRLQQTLRSAAASVRGWLGQRPRTVA